MVHHAICSEDSRVDEATRTIARLAKPVPTDYRAYRIKDNTEKNKKNNGVKYEDEGLRDKRKQCKTKSLSVHKTSEEIERQ